MGRAERRANERAERKCEVRMTPEKNPTAERKCSQRSVPESGRNAESQIEGNHGKSIGYAAPVWYDCAA